MEIRNDLKNNENKNTIYKSLWDAAKAIQRKFHCLMLIHSFKCLENKKD